MSFKSLPAFASWSGPRDARVVLLGEAWGQSEEESRRPFAGESGKELFRILGEAWPDVDPAEHSRVQALHKFALAWVGQRDSWLTAASCGLTNVLNFRPPGNKLEAICRPRPPGYPTGMPSLVRGGYLGEEYLTELDRLEEELAICQPNLVVCLGNTACWAMLRSTAIGSIRGTVAPASALWPGKCLPTYHPAAVLRMWSWRVIVVADLMKARREARTAEIIRPSRQVLVSPSIGEITRWVSETLSNPPELLSCDIETGGGQVKCVGFARSASEAIVIPFVDFSRLGWSYWPSQADEEFAWSQVKALLESPIPKVFQNGMYDLQYLVRLGLRPQNCLEDTMLLHHSHFPELQKGLGFLGSIYTNEASWKLMRRQRPDSEKRDE